MVPGAAAEIAEHSNRLRGRSHDSHALLPYLVDVIRIL